MEIEIKKARLVYRILFITVLIIFLGLFFYQLLFFAHPLLEKINQFLLVVLSIIWLIANFYKDRFNRYVKKEEIIDFWLFYINSLSKLSDRKEVHSYFALLPKLKKQSDYRVEIVRKRLNLYIISCYILLIGVIVTVIMIMT